MNPYQAACAAASLAGVLLVLCVLALIRLCRRRRARAHELAWQSHVRTALVQPPERPTGALPDELAYRRLRRGERR